MPKGFLTTLRASGIDPAEALRGAVRGLRPFSSYGDIGVVDDEKGVAVGRIGEPPHFIFVGLGLVNDKGPNDEADWPDERYWIKWALLATGTPTARLSFSLGAAGGNTTIETATNWYELNADGSAGTHLVPLDTPVWVFAVADTNGLDRLVFFHHVQNPQVVLCTVDGGSAGSGDPTPTTCDFTYSVTDLAGNAIPGGDTLTPKRPRFANVEYETPASASPGLLYYMPDGSIQLYEVVTEVPKTDDVCPDVE